MAFMDWVLDVAVKHPDLQGAFINVDGEWLDVLLSDGRTLRFRPGLMIDEAIPEEDRLEKLNRLISIGVTMAEPTAPVESSPAAAAEDPAYDQRSDATFGPQAARGESHDTWDDDDDEFDDFDHPHPDDDEPRYPILPIVRPADYFVSSHKHEQEDSLVYIPLTNFIGVGLAADKPETIEPLYFSDLDEHGISREIGPLFGNAVQQLRELNTASGKPGLELGMAEISGAKVFMFTSPENYQSSWFADLDMTQTVSESLVKEYGDVLPLFIPASRSTLLVVMADDPRLPAVLKALRGRVRDQDAIYPLPHTVASDGWQEWIPLPDHPAAKILGELRSVFRARIYNAQAEAMKSWPGNSGILKPFEVRRLRSGHFVSTTQWRSSDAFGSVPDTEYVTFVQESTGMPWEDNNGNLVTLLSRVAREVWDGFTPLEGVWPPRYAISSFPTPEQLAELRAAVDREV